MRFLLEFEPEVQQFLDGLTLSREARLHVSHALIDLRGVSDAIRANRANRLGAYFTFRRTFQDRGRLVSMRFVVDDSPAVYGVLRVVYIDLA